MKGLDTMRKYLAVPMVAALFCALAGAGAANAATDTAGAHAQIEGSGSSWAANAVNQWIADTASSGLQLVYTPNGSAQGRQDFASKTVDFAVSDIGYQGVDPATGLQDTSEGRAYAYLPIVAGGTSFPYQLRVGGQQVRNLRLSGLTLAKIFSNQITNWDDPAITHDNNGHSFPSLPIIPVVHSEGSGDSYQLTRYFVTVYGSTWGTFGGSKPTEYFPRAGSQVAENGSDGVMNYITSGAANGSIGYDEYSYALGANYPVVKLENKAGYFTLPNQYNVAVALTQAQINLNPASPDYLLQVLDHVYTYSDSRTYPLSSYSYMIEPTAANDIKMTTAKRQTLADYLFYAICQGQKEMGPIGYSPLPINLVQAGFSQIGKLHTADPGVDLTSENATHCDNPTFDPTNLSKNKLAEIAPLPAACDKSGAGPCAAGTDVGLSNPVGNTPGGSNNNSSGGNTPNNNTTTTTKAGSTKTNTGGTSPGSTTINPLTGATQSNTNSGGTASFNPSALSSAQSGSVDLALGILIGLLLVGLIVVPPLASQALKKRQGTS